MLDSSGRVEEDRRGFFARETLQLVITRNYTFSTILGLWQKKKTNGGEKTLKKTPKKHTAAGTQKYENAQIHKSTICVCVCLS